MNTVEPNHIGQGCVYLFCSEPTYWSKHTHVRGTKYRRIV